MLALAASAQSHVSPNHFAAVEGTSNSMLPFAAPSLPCRYLQVHDQLPAATLHGLAFRYEANNGLQPGFSVTLDAWVSTAATTAATTSTVFANNHGPDKIQVVNNRTLVMPANDPFQLPSPFSLDVAFDPGVSFAFAGGGAGLCWEILVTSHTNTSGALADAVFALSSFASNPPPAGTRAGSGCKATGRTQPMSAVPGNSPMTWSTGSGNLRVNSTQLQSNGAIAWVTGTNIATWSGLPLPLAIPTSVGAPSGTCTVYTDAAALTLATASGNGTATLTIPFAAVPALHGVLVYTQVLGLDAAANPFGMTTSNLVAQQVVAPYALPLGISRVYQLGGASGVVTLETSGVLVTKFY